MVVFPAIDLIPTVFFFAKLGTANLDYRNMVNYEWAVPAILFTFVVHLDYPWKHYSLICCNISKTASGVAPLTLSSTKISPYSTPKRIQGPEMSPASDTS